MNMIGSFILVAAAVCGFLAIMLTFTEILNVLKSIDAKLLTLESTIRRSPEGSYIRTDNRRDGT